MMNDKEPELLKDATTKTFKHTQNLIKPANPLGVHKPTRPMQNKPTSKPRGRG